ncbi:PKD domain-containing protein [Flavobacterium sp. NKUCC04_CG]|uniref:PKD domain-containing protein n=1 Tax=Flavobacterium sp. NKUCC04_CG TaxID=2842121 RepID=UPI001C5BE596|nr:PKD domain-containing protein [Flavobacterium sp. NKUCC04_CG]MBW3519964.1 T9SS type A sorting domain-containing protein [Flavobacterium sp. NKUCC04_CG]
MTKKFTLPPIIRAIGILLLLLMWSLKMEAQVANSPVLTWDQQVGCIEYDDEIKDREKEKLINLLENVEEGSCIRFCEGSRVNYTLQATNVSLVQWQVTGGALVSSSNTQAQVLWGASGSGSITLTVTYTDNTVQVRTICIEKIISPRAEFQINGPEPDQREFCTNTAISFDNLSTQNNGSAIVHYFWDFGDGATSNLFEPSHTYTQEGAYKVYLRVTNSCNCSSDYAFEVYVKDVKPVEITCTNVTCEGNRETYSVNDECGGKWKVEGGTIVADNGISIEVVWDNIDPSDGFGYVSYISDCSCPFWTTVKIPVVTRKAKIKGPDIICQGKQARFTLPQWPTTDFSWSIQPAGTNTTLVLTDQRNEIVVDALEPGDYILVVEYYNTLLYEEGCRGESSHRFKVVENVSVISDNIFTVCQGTYKSFSSSNGNSVKWQITLNNSVVHATVGSWTDYTFNSPGTYVVTANNNGCISDPVLIEVIKTPIITGVISGPNKVCLNVPYTYAISENEAGALYVWSAIGGSVVGNNQGTQVDFVFTSPNATVSVVKQYVKNGVTCSSQPISYNVTQVQMNPIIVNNSGLAMFCTSKSYEFSANLNGIDADLLEWEISPSNFGSIINGINGNTVTVGLNEASGGVNTGTLTLITTKCGIKTSVSHSISLVASISLSIGAVSDICPADLTFSVPVTSSAPVSAGGQLVFEYNGTAAFTTAYTGTGTYTVPQNFVTSSASSIGATLTVKLVNAFGCTTTILANKPVIVLPLTTVELFKTSNSPTVICMATPFAINFQSTVSTGVTSSLTFSWFYSNSATPFATQVGNPNFTLNNWNFQGAGDYYVQVTDINSCVIKSNKIRIFEDCSPGVPGGPGSGCVLPFNPFPDLNYLWTGCTTVSVTPQFYNIPPYNIVNVSWEAITPGAVVSPLSTNNLGVFEIPKVGSYDLRIRVRYDGCPDTFTKVINVRKHYEPILRYTVTCNGNNTYSINLLNNSKLFDINSNLVNITYLNSANNIIGTGQSVNVTGLTAGTHTFKLRLSTGQTTANGTPIPVCETTQQIVIDAPPALNFTLPDGFDYCTEYPVTLRLPNNQYNSNYRYVWLFNGTSYIASGVDTKINFALPSGFVNSFPVKLRIINQFDCVFESNPQMVTVRKANFTGGGVFPNPADFCESNVVPLTYVGGNMPSSIIWMRDNVQVGTNLSYTPTQSGSYWPVLIDANGCRSFAMSQFPVSYKLRKVPFASINGNTSVCYGGSTTLTGIVTDPTVEHRWTGPNVPGSFTNWVAGGTNLSFTLSGLSPGTHNYTFETRYAYDTSCVNSFVTSVQAHPQIATPNVSYSLVSCQPYTLRLTASGPNNGVYNWSNGATGKSIEVTVGGAYAVTYTAPTGCSVTGFVQAPHNPERSLWIVPTGCYDFCLTSKRFLLGPLGIYSGYNWMINGGAVQSGSNTSIPNQPIVMAGTYQLQVSQLGCIFKSNTLHVAPDLDNCPTRPCRIEASFEYAGMEQLGMYLYYVNLYNPNSYNVNVNISSFNNYGVFVPGTFNLTPGWNSFGPVIFQANSTFVPGAPDFIMVQMQGCMDLYEIKLPSKYRRAAAVNEEAIQATMVLSPNPAQDVTVASFDLGDQYRNAQSIVIYDVTGMQRAKQKVSGNKGEVTLNVHQLAAGTYIVSLEADGKRIIQQKLIKK